MKVFTPLMLIHQFLSPSVRGFRYLDLPDMEVLRFRCSLLPNNQSPSINPHPLSPHLHLLFLPLSDSSASPASPASFLPTCITTTPLPSHDRTRFGILRYLASRRLQPWAPSTFSVSWIDQGGFCRSNNSSLASSDFYLSNARVVDAPTGFEDRMSKRQ